jgi:hypothetical protein
MSSSAPDLAKENQELKKRIQQLLQEQEVQKKKVAEFLMAEFGETAKLQNEVADNFFNNFFSCKIFSMKRIT